MSEFDPTAHATEQGERRGVLDVGGVFLVAFVKILGRGETKSGKPWIKFLARVIGNADNGPPGHDGKVLFPRVFISPGSYSRLAALCAAMGRVERFHLDDDRSVHEAMCFRPFKAKLDAKQWVNNRGAKMIDVQIAFSEPSMSPAERDACDAWAAEQDAEREAGGSDSYDAGGGGDSFYDAPHPGDTTGTDDIPF